MAKTKLPKTPKLTRDEWVATFAQFFADQHCTLFGRAHPTALPREQAATAEVYADIVMKACGLHDDD